MIRRFLTRRHLFFVVGVAGVILLVSGFAMVRGNTGITFIGAILAGLAILAPFLSQEVADTPRIRAEFVYSMFSDKVAVMLSNTGTGPGYVREIRMDVASEQDYTHTVTYSIDEIALYPRQRVYLPIRESDAKGWMITQQYDKIVLTFRADVQSEQGRILSQIERVSPADRAPRSVTGAIRIDDGFWRDEKGKGWNG